MTDTMYTEDWQAIPWAKVERNVRRLQQRIYQAASRGDGKQVRNLQRLLQRSWSARCLAVRQVTQDNRGKRTPGVDGVAGIDPPFRSGLVVRLKQVAAWIADPIRRVYIDKTNSDEKRPLGIPTIRDRAMQALVKLVLEPEWEAKFEPNSYGFRPGRATHDAIESIYNFIRLKPKYVLDADIAKCFDQISHSALLQKLNASTPIVRLVRQWLKAGIMEGDVFYQPEAGTPQGGVISPLLANIALHGLENELVAALPQRQKPGVIRYADDFVILHEDLDTLNMLRERAEAWLAPMGLHLNPSKTSITHTLHQHEGKIGFDFLGFHIRQHPIGKYRTRTYRGKAGFRTLIKPSQSAQKRHLGKVRDIIRQYRGAPQIALIAKLNPIIRGWTNYYRPCAAKKVFARMDFQVYFMLRRWATHRHHDKPTQWRYRRYWHRVNDRVVFGDEKGALAFYRDTPIRRHVKVRGEKSPFDGDWLYWGTRLGRDPTKPKRVTRLLKCQHGKCEYCGLRFKDDDIMEVHHQDGDRNNNRYANLALLHGHCHDQTHGKGY